MSNEIFCLCWRIFRKAEADDLLQCLDNNATCANEQTGVYPFNPYGEAWMDTIDGLGCANSDCPTLSYEILPSSQDKMSLLPPENQKLLQSGLKLEDMNDFDNYNCAEIQAAKILGN
jgi:hypothetical protein